MYNCWVWEEDLEWLPGLSETQDTSNNNYVDTCALVT